MSDNEVAIAIIAIIFGSVLGIIVVVKLFELIKSWINRNKNTYDEEKFDRLAKAFIRYKKESEQRLQNLEAIVTDADSPSSSSRELEETQLHHSIEVDSDKEQKEKKESGSGNLRNMLKE